MSLGTRSLATATRLIRKFGRVLTFTRQGKTEFDTNTGTVLTSTNTEYNVYCVTKTSTVFQQLVKYLTQSANSEIIIEYSVTYTPIICDKVSIDGIEYKIMTVSPSEVQGTILLYTLGISI